MTTWDQLAGTNMAELAEKLGPEMQAENTVVFDPVLSGIHPSGATAMAKTPEDGVCDENLTVHGLQNLHLVSSSVFSHMGANPPTLTIAALALRLASHLERLL